MKTLKQLNDDLENARGGLNTGDIEDAVAAIEVFRHQELKQKAVKLAEAIKQVYELRMDSEGVTGLHRNGDVATWDWLCQDEGWLSLFHEADQIAEEMLE